MPVKDAADIFAVFIVGLVNVLLVIVWVSFNPTNSDNEPTYLILQFDTNPIPDDWYTKLIIWPDFIVTILEPALLFITTDCVELFEINTFLPLVKPDVLGKLT